MITELKNAKRITLPDDVINERVYKELYKDDVVLISGTLYTARDQAHKRIVASINNGEPLPFDLNNAAIYYCGPTPALDGQIIGSCGPTTSVRMDDYTPALLDKGLKVMIGKGVRELFVTHKIRKHCAIYFCAIGGAAALYQSTVTACELIAYPDLGCEAVYKLTVKDFPAVLKII